MGLGILHTLHTLNHAVNQFQTLGTVGVNLEHEVKLTGQIIARSNGRLVADHLAEVIKIARMLKTDLHERGQIIAELFLIEQDGVLVDGAVFFELADALEHCGDGKIDLRADGGGFHARIFTQQADNLKISMIHVHIPFKTRGRKEYPAVWVYYTILPGGL